ncbi:hypothetical protein J2Z22_004460 [Paenibacillus forsythiae]|uniref:Glycosyltransferase 2-like domain-containing protein n=1 Tax=Paenibacillus forsythiae TaxID=365616 RepID=A0ABU3HEG8_9BACL|nr:glycosyltransferase [Paenibacillus forsythiae]MDT3428866.1 hypothetical protein [Paenibacillus forsythiae]
MAKVKLTIIIAYHPDHWQSSLLAINQLRLNVKLEVIWIVSNKFNFRSEQLEDHPFECKLLHWANIDDLVQKINFALTASQGQYISLIGEDEILDPEGFMRMIENVEKHQSDIIMGSYVYFDTTQNSYIKHPTFGYEKMKKYFYNTTLENEPALILSLNASGNKIFRRSLVTISNLAISKSDIVGNYKPFFLQILIQSKEITYLPYVSCLVQSGKTAIHSVSTFLDISHELRKKIFSKKLLRLYEAGILLELSWVLTSEEFILFSDIEKMSLLSKIEKKMEGYDIHLFKILFPQYDTLFDLLHHNLYWECIEYLNIVFEKETSRMSVARHRKEYHSMKKDMWKPIVKLNNMLKRWGNNSC